MAEMAQRIVVVGGGPAAVSAAVEAKKKDPTATVTLLTDEACEPYEKPPLSKAVLLGKVKPEDAPIGGPGGIAKYGVVVKLSTRCVAINRVARLAATTSCVLPYDSLVIATGSIVRELPSLPTGMPRVHYLRTETQARAIKADLATCKNLVVIGAGLIGLEVRRRRSTSSHASRTSGRFPNTPTSRTSPPRPLSAIAAQIAVVCTSNPTYVISFIRPVLHA
jgi:3-phenylpropionate/trans-cinnamate dioxygenase ferredoxin reductase component